LENLRIILRQVDDAVLRFLPIASQAFLKKLGTLADELFMHGKGLDGVFSAYGDFDDVVSEVAYCSLVYIVCLSRPGCIEEMGNGGSRIPRCMAEHSWMLFPATVA
jgi:hypothetical protein